MVQEQMKNSKFTRKENIDFAFTKIMKCGLCGSGISATEKFKKLKNGEHNRHVYYGCTKAKDKHCKCGYINEADLIKQLTKLVDLINLNELGIKKQLNAEVVRYKKFSASLLGKSTDIVVSDIDVKKYVKFLLREGVISEKRELLSCLKSKIVLKNKLISIKK
jgi:hypothetical protein